MTAAKKRLHIELDINLYDLLKEQAQSLDVTVSGYLRTGLARIADDNRIRTEQLKQIAELKEQVVGSSTEYFRSELDDILAANKEKH